jgi:autotransporter family porin
VNGGDPADGNWYLRSEVVVPSPTPTPSGLIARLLYRPEVGAYLSNRRQTSGMFLHGLQDRAGEPQGGEAQDETRRPGWIRISGKDTDAAAPGGLFSVNSHSTLVRGGGDIVRRPAGGDGGRLHLGAMLGCGKSTGDAHTPFNPRQAHGKVEEWSAGLYGSWYQHGAGKPGAYADAWAAYSGFHNSVRGDTLPEVKYKAASYTVSGEAGYAIKLGASDWVVEPQAQLVYVKYDEDEITEPNGTRISGKDGSGWISRLGVRSYRSWVREGGRTLQPYLTLNWWQDSVANELSFNTVALKDIHPGKRYEVKAGLTAGLAPGWTAWGDLGYQWGEQGYRSKAIRLGAAFTW